ncbi:MAG: hypothetical protein U1B83_03845 [Candidatus Cloacimonadaceae bacterium]|nr:hypothetical protein [Candidatus Cloacimonadaceae bacterium]
MREDMIPADPQYRAGVIRMTLILFALGILVIGLLLPYLKERIMLMEPSAAVRLLRPYLTAMLILPALAGIYLCVYAIRCLRQGRFPLEGARVIRDTPVYYEAAARKRLVFMLFLSVLLIDFSVFAAIYLNRFLDTLLI